MRRAIQMMCVAAVVAASGSAALAVHIETVPVGNAGNADDTEGAGYGGVSYDYRIGKYEVTAGQYCEFLNAVAATDTYGLYNGSMDSSSYGCQITQNGTSGNYTYDFGGRPSGTEANWEDRPVNYVSWGDAARFANWLTNGQTTGVQDASTTEDGSYDLNGAVTDAALLAVTRTTPEQCGRYHIPTEDEWYKAAYHKNDGVTGNYFNYPTSNDSRPSNDLVDPDPGNNATFDDSGYTIGSPYYRTEVGEHENSDSPYETFDQGGNVWEWNESIWYGSRRGLRGGSFNRSDNYLVPASYRHDNPTYEYYYTGFRVSQVPEPAKPVGDADGPYTIDVGDPLVLNASGSTDADEDIISYMWDLNNDGLYETDAGGNAFYVVVYADLISLGLDVRGTYDIHLKVTDDTGLFDRAGSQLTMIPEPGTLSLLGLGACLPVFRRKRR